MDPTRIIPATPAVPSDAERARQPDQEATPLTRVAIFTDSASDLDAAEAASLGVTVIPLLVTFGDKTFRAGHGAEHRGVLGAHDRRRRAVPQDGGLLAR